MAQRAGRSLDTGIAIVGMDAKTTLEMAAFTNTVMLRYLDFNARMLRDEHADGGEIRWFRLSLASWYGFALPHIDVAYDRQSHELREYSGLSNIRDGDGRNLSVTIRFPPSERRTEVTRADVERAAEMPLTGRCMFQ